MDKRLLEIEEEKEEYLYQLLYHQNKLNMLINTFKLRKDILHTKTFRYYYKSNYFNIRYDNYKSRYILIINKKKEEKKSVKRNLLRRRIKNILKEINFSVSLVIISKPLAFSTCYKILKEEFFKIISYINFKNSNLS